MIDNSTLWTVAQITGWVLMLVALTLAVKKRVIDDPAASRRIKIAFVVLGVVGGLLASTGLWVKYFA